MRQTCRPKHQVLVLKCYPKFSKNAVDVKPNPSELSYLLYYASTRRSKVPKVGSFLEKRTASDVWRGRLSNVKVTLQILKALIEKSPRDLPLYAPSILTILHIILHSKDVTMVEDTLPTFAAFCQHHDGASLAADQDYRRQYEDVVKVYAAFVTHPTAQSKGPITTPMALRWRSIGLQAINSIVSSEALGADGGRQLQIIMPVLLESLYSDREDHLHLLQERALTSEQGEEEKTMKRRMSIGTVQTVDTNEARPEAAAGTAADADRLAEEHNGILALLSLRHIYTADSRGQIRAATAVALHFIAQRTYLRGEATSGRSLSARRGGWSTALVEMMAQWAPVQDRYIILVTAMEMLVQSPVIEDNLEQQIVLTAIVGWLLSSSVNLIGLSVMDVLLGLIQHILLLLQLGGSTSTVQPHRQQIYAVGSDEASRDASRRPSPTGSLSKTGKAELVATPSPLRIELLERLRGCIGDLATHIYYSDQIADMLSAILLRLKPSPLITTAVGAIEHPVAAARAISASANLQESPDTDHFFSFDTARTTALRAIKDVLIVANTPSSETGLSSANRNRAGVRVWEGTQWLLRDPDGRVRKAYVDALLAWLDREVSKSDLKVLDDTVPTPRQPSHGGNATPTDGRSANRAVSTASQREKSKPSKSNFLQLLHLSIYENALQYAESESDIMLLHLLMTALVRKLGINAVKDGLPMIFRLQQDMASLDSPAARVRLGSLVHGYFWVLGQKFDFDTSTAGREIGGEIDRRKRKGLWTETIGLPPRSIQEVRTPRNSIDSDALPLQNVDAEALRSFNNRMALIERIAVAYAASIDSPPGSPPTSPGRKFSMPILGRPSDLAHQQSGRQADRQIPNKIREQMLLDWSRDAVLAHCRSDNSRAVSLNGSRTGTNRSAVRSFLAVNGMTELRSGSGTQSPRIPSNAQDHHQSSRPPSATAQGLAAIGAIGGLGAIQKLRNMGSREASPTAFSNSSRDSTVRVDDLKRVLSGDAVVQLRGFSRGRQAFLSPDTSSESMMSADASTSDASFSGAPVGTVDFALEAKHHRSSRSRSRGRNASERTVRDYRDAAPGHADAADDGIRGMGTAHSTEEERHQDAEAVPPVPPVPGPLMMPGAYQSEINIADPASQSVMPEEEAQDFAEKDTKPRQDGVWDEDAPTGTTRIQRSRGQGRSHGPHKRGTLDVATLLGSIEVSPSPDGKGAGARGVGSPPY
ncbi:MAG: plasma membrane localization protein [Caeruleum heppii]|nr:MAG: plasma membrane localization protein [Caeruleum heppii]